MRPFSLVSSCLSPIGQALFGEEASSYELLQWKPYGMLDPTVIRRAASGWCPGSEVMEAFCLRNPSFPTRFRRLGSALQKALIELP